MGRRWVLSAIAVAAVAGLVFAIVPQWDLAIPGWFLIPSRGFPTRDPVVPESHPKHRPLDNLAYRVASRRVSPCEDSVSTHEGAAVARIALFLVCSFAIGPGLVVNGILPPGQDRARSSFRSSADNRRSSPGGSPAGTV